MQIGDGFYQLPAFIFSLFNAGLKSIAFFLPSSDIILLLLIAFSLNVDILTQAAFIFEMRSILDCQQFCSTHLAHPMFPFTALFQIAPFPITAFVVGPRKITHPGPAKQDAGLQ